MMTAFEFWLLFIVLFKNDVVKAQPPGGGGGGGRPGGGGVGGRPGGGGGGGGGGAEVETCSGGPATFNGNNPNNNQRPSQGLCMSNWNNIGETKLYPDDFESILNKVEIYECPISQRRIIRSNGIPNHNVNLYNNQGACEYNYLINLPLYPNLTLTTETKTEIPIRGMIAMAINGVPTYGPHEANSYNAVEGPNTVGGSALWYGHAGNAKWHFHNPHMGKENVTSDDLLGYALDGFPIYGPLMNGTLSPNEIDNILDECNGIFDNETGTYRYHVRTKQQVNETLEYCNNDGGNSPITNWNYILGCYSGSIDDTQIMDSTTYTLPDDCVEVVVLGYDGNTDTASDGDEGGQPDVTQQQLQEPKTTPTTTTSTTNSQQQQQQQQGRKRQPNIIVMQPDDFQWFDEWGRPPNNPIQPDHEILFPNNDGQGLPNLERLRNDGLQMLQAYTASPMCGTSRYSTITGKYPSRAVSSRFRNNNLSDDEPATVTIPTTKLEGEDCSDENLAVAFSNVGYRTGMIGKWHLTRFDRNNDYDYEFSVDVIQGCGFDFVDGLYIENLNRQGGFNGDGSFSHNMEWITSVAIDFIQGQEDDDRPFFLYFNPTIPHGSADVRTSLEDYPCRNTASGALDSDPIIKGMTEEYGNCEDYRQSVLDRATTEEELGPIWLDDSVGALLQTLEDMNILDDTIFLFQNDHGMETKSALYENGIRIPQFIHYPNGGLSGGLKFDAPVSTIDIGPTLLDYAGITTLPYPMDGISWKKAITLSYNNNTNITSGTIAEDIEMNWKMNRCLFFEIEKDRAVRCGCYKLLHIYDDGSNSATSTRGRRNGYSTDEENLFDLCGGTDYEYVVDMSMNQEQDGYNLIDSGDLEETVSFLSDALGCHLTRTNIEMDPPGYNQRCGTEDMVNVEGLSGGGDDDCTDSEVPICGQLPDFNSNDREMLCNASAIAEACPLACGLCSF